MTRKSDANRKYIERENLDAFLEHFAELDESMPTSVAHADKPDFILTFPDKAVGVEVTRSVAQEFVRAERLQAIHSPSSWINLTYLNDGDRRRSDAEIAASAFGMGWQPVEIGNRHWKAKITRSINTKRQKLNRPGYNLFPENWLLIRDLPGLPLDWLRGVRAVDDLLEVLPIQVPRQRDFDTVFIQSGAWLFRWTEANLAYSFRKYAQEEMTRRWKLCLNNSTI
jgi:hypothetical protein